MLFTLVLSLVLSFTKTVTAQTTCERDWFFSYPAVEGCPQTSTTASRAAFMQFENGFMIWVSGQDTIYVLYISEESPRWESYEDEYENGMPETDPAFTPDPSTLTYQPRRGFGLIWRENDTVRERIGYAFYRYEFAYNIRYQTGEDGTIYLRDRRGGVFALYTNGDWARFEAR
jgi:hypothetical protein